MDQRICGFPSRHSHEAFPRGFPTRLSHRAVPCATVMWVDPRLESRGSAGKTGSLEWTENSGCSGNGDTTLEFLSPFLWRGPPLEMRLERRECFTLHGKVNSQLSLDVQRVTVRINPRRNTWSPIGIKLAKIKDKDKILKATSGKMANNIQGNSHQVISWFLNRNSTNQKRMTLYI